MDFNFVRSTLASTLTAVGIFFAPAVSAETLTDALISAYNQSGLLEQNRALLRAADEDVAVAVAALRPIIGYSASASYADPTTQDNLTANLTLSAQLLLYDFGGTKLGVDVAKETVLTARERLINIEQQVLLRAVTAYLEVRRQTEFVSLNQNNVRLIGQELRAAKDRFEVGEVTRTDVALAEARLASSQSNLAAAQGDLVQAREEYLAVVGHYPKTLSALPKVPKTAKSVDAAIAVALRTHPDLLEAQRNVTVAELNIRRAAAQMKPTLDVTGRVGVNQDFDNSSNVTLELSGPIYSGGSLSAVYRRSLARRDASRAALLDTTRLVRQNVANAWSDLAVARARLSASEGQIRASRVAYQGVKEEATLGARTTLDVLDAEQDLLDAQADQISAFASQYVQSYSVLSAMGLLTAKHLGLGVKTYDPAAYYNAVKNAPATSTQGARLDRVLRSIGKN